MKDPDYKARGYGEQHVPGVSGDLSLLEGITPHISK